MRNRIIRVHGKVQVHVIRSILKGIDVMEAKRSRKYALGKSVDLFFLSKGRVKVPHPHGQAFNLQEERLRLEGGNEFPLDTGDDVEISRLGTLERERVQDRSAPVVLYASVRGVQGTNDQDDVPRSNRK